MIEVRVASVYEPQSKSNYDENQTVNSTISHFHKLAHSHSTVH